MKILHTSDLHINSPLTSHLTADKAATRRREINGSLHRVIDAARKNFAAAIVIAGDLFDSEEISRRELEATLTQIREAADISFYYLPGNHEKNALQSTLAEIPENLFVFGDGWTYFDTGAVVFAGRRTTEENMFDTLTLFDGRKNIVVLHGEARTASAARGIIGIKEAGGRNITYLALGHYHKYSAFPIDALGIAVYSGTPEGRGFDECGECGAVLIDTDSPYPYHRFIKTARRTLHSLEINVDGSGTGADVAAAVAAATESIPSSDILRATLVGKVERDVWIDTDGISESLLSRFFHAELCDKTGVSVRIEDYQHDPTLRGELVRSVMADEALTESEKEKIIACALAALDGVEYFGV